MGGYHYIYKQKIQLFVLLRSYASSSQIRHQAKHSALLSKVIFGDEDWEQVPPQYSYQLQQQQLFS